MIPKPAGNPCGKCKRYGTSNCFLAFGYPCFELERFVNSAPKGQYPCDHCDKDKRTECYCRLIAEKSSVSATCGEWKTWVLQQWSKIRSQYENNDTGNPAKP